MNNWKEYTATDEQIAEIISATSGILIRNRYKDEAPNIWKIDDEWGVPLSHLKNLDIKGKFAPYEYLICTLHPLADMIIRQAQTGQPVYWKNKETGELGENYPGVVHWEPNVYEYSFTPFKD